MTRAQASKSGEAGDQTRMPTSRRSASSPTAIRRGSTPPPSASATRRSGSAAATRVVHSRLHHPGLALDMKFAEKSPPRRFTVGNA